MNTTTTPSTQDTQAQQAANANMVMPGAMSCAQPNGMTGNTTQLFPQMGQPQMLNAMQLQAPAQQMMGGTLGQQNTMMDAGNNANGQGSPNMMGQPPNLMGNQAPFTVNSSNVMPQHQHYQPGPNGNYSLIPQHATGAYNQPPMQNMGMQRQPNMQTQGGGGGKFNFPCDNCDGYGRGTNYCPFPQDDLKIANKKSSAYSA
jgi:hypothetical protein